jgi:hypothetical protein
MHEACITKGVYDGRNDRDGLFVVVPQDWRVVVNALFENGDWLAALPVIADFGDAACDGRAEQVLGIGVRHLLWRGSRFVRSFLRDGQAASRQHEREQGYGDFCRHDPSS